MRKSLLLLAFIGTSLFRYNAYSQWGIINTIAGLPLGVTVPNHAGVFFGYDPVATTNPTEDSVCIPPTTGMTSAHLGRSGEVCIYPNPSTGQLAIKTDGTTYNAFMITNTLGVVLVQDIIKGATTTVDMSLLPPGMYYVTLIPQYTANPSPEGSTVVRKVVKE